MSLQALSADEIIRRLNLRPHPEGGHFCETFRDSGSFGGRPHSTAIYFLLKRGESSRWHSVDAVEIWHFYAGAALELSISSEGEPVETIHLGSDLLAGERPQVAVPANAWQQAKSLGDWTLVGCTVAPGFQFEGFELAPKGWEPP
jgi:predicted cupin superfamily sugar epimerase